MTDASPSVAQHSLNSKPLAVAFLASLGLICVGCGIISLCVAFSPGGTLTGRLLMMAMGAVSLFLPARLTLASLHLKWTTGRWMLMPAERMDRLSRIATKKPSRMLRFASLLAGSNVMPGITLVLAAVNVWLQARKEMHAIELLLVIGWSALAALSLWHLLRKYRSAPES